MEDEAFFTGYCRALDASRTVSVEREGVGIWADCAYPDCPHAPACPIAGEIKDFSN